MSEADSRQKQNDGRDARRAFRWGVWAVVVLVVLAIGAYLRLSAQREASPVVVPENPVRPAEPPRAPGS